jgi:2-desacetyl-2-hydroxyethyl bacteriochlorophyllide A dehydrogenase
MKARAIVYVSPNHTELRDFELPDPGAGEYLFQTVYSAVSPGTELRNLSGKMRGDLAVFPAIGGYLNVSRIIGRGSGLGGGLPDGTLVFSGGTQKCDVHRTWGGHVSHGVSRDVLPVPTHVDPRDAVLTKLGAIAYLGSRHADAAPHESVAVVGLGPIGQLSLRVHRMRGCRAVGFDVSADRVAIASAAGCEAHALAGTLAETAARVQPRGFDVVVDATGAKAVLDQSVLLLRDRPWQEPPFPGTRLVIQGSYVAEIAFDYFTAFMRGCNIHLPRDNQYCDLVAVMGLLDRGMLRLQDLLSEIAAPSACQEVYSRLLAGKSAYMTAAFDWSR